MLQYVEQTIVYFLFGFMLMEVLLPINYLTDFGRLKKQISQSYASVGWLPVDAVEPDVFLPSQYFPVDVVFDKAVEIVILRSGDTTFASSNIFSASSL